MKAKTIITQLRFEPALLKKITEAAKKTSLSKADIMRLAREVGLEDLRRVDFDLPALISHSASLTSNEISCESADEDSKPSM